MADARCGCSSLSAVSVSADGQVCLQARTVPASPSWRCPWGCMSHRPWVPTAPELFSYIINTPSLAPCGARVSRLPPLGRSPSAPPPPPLLIAVAGRRVPECCIAPAVLNVRCWANYRTSAGGRLGVQAGVSSGSALRRWSASVARIANVAPCPACRVGLGHTGFKPSSMGSVCHSAVRALV